MKLEALELPLNVLDNGFKAGIGAAVAGVTALVGAMGAAVKSTFTWAAQLDSIQDIIGGTNEEAAALNFTLRKSGTSTDTFTKSMTIFNKGLVKADGTLDTVGKGLADWGINVKDANGNLKSQNQLIAEASKKYNSFTTQQERVNFLTEAFGRGGAEMIDFFDTLAAEGGLDAVTEKVNRFGLVIDPARYENFTRSLEELKLIGTGRAVEFTEKLMPALESLLTWTNRFATADLDTQMEILSEPFKRLFNLTDAFKRGAEETDWAGISQDLAEKINNIDFVTIGSYIRQGVSNVLQGLSTIIQEIDWNALAISAGESLKELVAGLSGYPDWDSFATAFNQKVNAAFDRVRNYSMKDFEADWAAFIDGLKTALQNLIEWGQDQNALSPGRNVQGGWTTSPSAPGRASGGPVIGGQTYFAHAQEIFTDGMFVAPSNGRIDNVQPSQPQGGVNEDRLANKITTSMANALIQAGLVR